MSLESHIQEHVALRLGGLGSRNLAMVNGPQQLISKVNAFSDRKRVRVNHGTPTLTLTNGSAVVTASGTTWRTGTASDRPRFFDLIQFGSDTRFYKIKSVDTDTQITLYETYQGTSVVATATAMITYYLDWITFLLMPGEYTFPVSPDHLVVHPGQAFVGMSKYGCILSEGSSSPPTPFFDWGENRVENLTIAPTNDFGSLDGLFSVAGLSDAKTWAGMVSKVSNCRLSALNLNGEHSGGNLRLPLIGQGHSIIEYCEIENDNPSGFQNIGGRTGVSTSADTKVSLNHCVYKTLKGFGLGASFSSPGMLTLDLNATYNIDQSIIDMEDLAVSPSSLVGNPGALFVPSTVTDVVANFSSLTSRVANTRASGSSIPSCIDVRGPCTLNITRSDLEAEGTGAVAIECAHASAVINVRGTRLKGTTNSVNCSAGTVNLDTASTEIGGTTGVGTINDSTPAPGLGTT